jgi:hypothetical protein
MPFLRQPDSAFSGAQLEYLREVARVINAMPQFSYFTQASPNGVLQGAPGDRAIYIGSTSTLSREWVKASDPGVVSTTSWVQLGVVP